MNTEAKARYVRVVGLGNTADATFHLTEVSVYGTPVGVSGSPPDHGIDLDMGGAAVSDVHVP